MVSVRGPAIPAQCRKCGHLYFVDKFAGGPVGLETLAAAVGEERATIEEVYEPFLIQEGFLARTPKGRVATALTYENFERQPGRRDIASMQQKLLYTRTGARPASTKKSAERA